MERIHLTVASGESFASWWNGLDQTSRAETSKCIKGGRAHQDPSVAALAAASARWALRSGLWTLPIALVLFAAAVLLPAALAAGSVHWPLAALTLAVPAGWAVPRSILFRRRLVRAERLNRAVTEPQGSVDRGSLTAS